MIKAKPSPFSRMTAQTMSRFMRSHSGKKAYAHDKSIYFHILLSCCCIFFSFFSLYDIIESIYLIGIEYKAIGSLALTTEQI